MSTKILVSNINADKTCERHLLSLFLKYGEIRSVKMMGTSAIITYQDYRDANDAFETSKGWDFVHGHKLEVVMIEE